MSWRGIRYGSVNGLAGVYMAEASKNLRQTIASVTAVASLVVAVFVIDSRYATSVTLLRAEAELQRKMDQKADKILLDALITGLINSIRSQKVRELKREQWRINNKPVLNAADRYMLQDIETDIELLERPPI